MRQKTVGDLRKTPGGLSVMTRVSQGDGNNLTRCIPLTEKSARRPTESAELGEHVEPVVSAHVTVASLVFHVRGPAVDQPAHSTSRATSRW